MPIRPLLPLWLLLFAASAAGAAIPGWRFTLGSYEDAYGSVLAAALQTSGVVGNSIGVAEATRVLAEEPVLSVGLGVVVVAALICLGGALASPPTRVRGATA